MNRQSTHCVATAMAIAASIAVKAPLLCAQGTPAPPLELTRLKGPVTVDGVPDEAAWRDIPALPLTMYTPVFRGTPTQRTEIRVAYDDEFFYAAGWFYDTDPSSIRVNSLYRDRSNGDDALAIYLDAFNDNRNAKWFGITAGGVRFDQLVSDDGATLNGSWDTFWTARTTITKDGWFTEVRIPFSSVRAVQLRRRTASTSTCACATLSPRERTSGWSTTKGWTRIRSETSPADGLRRHSLVRSSSSTRTRSGSENLFTTLVTVGWNWLLRGDTLGMPRTPVVIPRSRRRGGILLASLVARPRGPQMRSLVAVAPRDDSRGSSPCSNQFQLTVTSAFPRRPE